MRQDCAAEVDPHRRIRPLRGEAGEHAMERSARTPDGKAVVATLWQDEFERRGGRLIYARSASDYGEHDSRPGFHEMMENLTWARDHCDGLFRVIIAIAKDTTARPRSIKECFPSEMVMRLESIDTNTGAFVAVAELHPIGEAKALSIRHGWA